MEKTQTIEAHWCPRCRSHVTSCRHGKPAAASLDESDHDDPDDFSGLAAVADDVQRVAKAGSTLARGFGRALNDAAGILGGRIRRRRR
jgi:hypothetical protein